MMSSTSIRLIERGSFWGRICDMFDICKIFMFSFIDLYDQLLKKIHLWFTSMTKTWLSLCKNGVERIKTSTGLSRNIKITFSVIESGLKSLDDHLKSNIPFYLSIIATIKGYSAVRKRFTPCRYLQTPCISSQQLKDGHISM